MKSWHGRRGITSSDQPLPLPYDQPPSLLYLLQPSSPSTWTRIIEPRPQIHCQRWSWLVLARWLWPRVGHQRWPYLVSNHAAATSIWPSMTVMLSPCTITTTMNRLLVIALLGPISAVELRPWVRRQGVYINSSINSLLIAKEANGIAITNLHHDLISRLLDLRIYGKSTLDKFCKGSEIKTSEISLSGISLFEVKEVHYQVVWDQFSLRARDQSVQLQKILD